ncbi:MAG TPA: ABC transporter permease [Gemmatimonadaceae bacterium]|nr:ABC transporter permease [Gemmatimonadaceae bacterium]
MRTGNERETPLSAADRAYRLLLRLYPRDFREQFGGDMTDFFRDRRTAARRSGGASRVAGVWVSAIVDVIGIATLERAAALARLLRGAREWWAEDPTHINFDSGDEAMLATLAGDIRYAVRGMLTKRAFSAVVLATLALGIGANVAIFSVVNGVLLQPLPYKDADRIVQIGHVDRYATVSEPEFVDYRDGTKRFERMAAFAQEAATLTDDRDPERVTVGKVSDGFFSILQVPAALGRTFTPEEDLRHGSPRRAVVLSHGLWTRRFGSDSSVVGKQIRLDDVSVTVVGVMPERFAFPSTEISVWTPLRLNYDTLWTRNNHYLTLIARLKPGVPVAAANTDLNTLAKQFVRDYPNVYGQKEPLVAAATPLPDQLLGKTRPYLFALLGAVGFVLLIACVNVANLLLARGEARQKELAIRTALGASRSRLARQVLTESALYAVVGGALGVALAWWAQQLLRAAAPASIPRVDEVSINGGVLAFALVVTTVTGVLFGLIPALRGSRGDAIRSLRSGGKTSSQAGLGKARGVLVVSEVALAVVLLTGAGLMLRSLWRLQSIELGIKPENVLTMSVSFPEPRAALNEPAGPQRATAQFYRDLIGRAGSLPGVRSAGAVGYLPIADGYSIWSILVDGGPVVPVSQAPSAMPQQVTPGYFRTMGISVLRGREFTDADREDAPLVAMVNEAAAKKLWPGKSPIGGTIKMLSKTAPWATVVGVVKDVRSAGYQQDVEPTMYFPHAQAGKSAYYTPAEMSLVIKTVGDPTAVAAPVRNIVKQLSAVTPVSRVQTMEQVVSASVASRRFSTELLAGFAGLALLLAGLGIYGVIAYDVSQRTQEIGLRMALGAQTGQVAGMMLGRGVRLVAIGLGLGVVGSLAVTGLLESLLVDVSRLDPLTIGGVVVVLAIVAAAAAYLPARRASAVDPMVALRRD